MAKYTVNHVCGHQQTHFLFGPHKEREHKLEWLTMTLCHECWQAKREEERQQASVLAAIQNAAEGLAPLSGSPRQIEWAEVLRAEMLASVQEAARKWLDDIAAIDSLTPRQEQAKAAAVDAITWLSFQTEATFWIENRDARGMCLVLVCPAVAPYLTELCGEAWAARLKEREKQQIADAAEKAAKIARERELQERREADRLRLKELTGLKTLAVKTDGASRVAYLGDYPSPVIYYRDGNRYNKPDTLICGLNLAHLAEQRSVSVAQQQADLLAFCRDLCGYWSRLRLG